MEQLAINGGPKAKDTPYNRPNRYGDTEIKYLTEAINEGRLMCVGSSMVSRFEDAICRKYNVSYCIMCSSGSAAIHASLAAVGVAEGDEVITTPMSDVGTVIGILAQHAVPIFDDISSDSCVMDTASVEQVITPKTKAILVVHKAGIVVDMDAVLEIGRKYQIAVVEDCSQCHLGYWKDQVVGSIGDVGAFSMNESKHMSTGDGGFITTNDPQIAKFARLFTDKTYQRDSNIERGSASISFLGMNYRPTALQAAVGLAQLERLDANIAGRAQIAERYFAELSDLPFISFPNISKDCKPAWWPVPIRYTAENPTRNEIAKALEAEGIWVDTGMSPANNMMRTELFEKRKFYPFTDEIPFFWRDTIYNPDSCPNVDILQKQVLRLPMDERFTDDDITQTIKAYKKVWAHYFGH